MKIIYLSLLFLYSGLTLFAQNSDKIIVHAEAGAKFDAFDKNVGYTGYQFFLSGLHPFDNNFAAGVGAGFNKFHKSSEEFIAIPVYANVFYKMPKSRRKFTSFVEAKLGYGIISKEYEISETLNSYPPIVYDFQVTYSGGIYIAPSIGIFFPVKNNAISVSISYDLQRVNRKWENLSNGEISEQSKFNSKTVAWKIGFLF